MRKNDSFKHYVTGNLGPKASKFREKGDKIEENHDFNSAPAKVNKVMKRDKGH